MRRITAQFFISLDGVVEAPDSWHFDFVDDEVIDWVTGRNAAADALLFGRVTYDSFASVWPHRQGPMADYYNSVTKYVVSGTRTRLDWQNSVHLGGDPSTAIRTLVDGPGDDIALSGSTTLVRWLLARGLLDELALLVHPVVLGRGARLFDGVGRHGLTLATSRTLSRGSIALTYSVDRPSAAPERSTP